MLKTVQQIRQWHPMSKERPAKQAQSRSKSNLSHKLSLRSRFSSCAAVEKYWLGSILRQSSNFLQRHFPPLNLPTPTSSPYFCLAILAPCFLTALRNHYALARAETRMLELGCSFFLRDRRERWFERVRDFVGDCFFEFLYNYVIYYQKYIIFNIKLKQTTTYTSDRIWGRH